MSPIVIRFPTEDEEDLVRRFTVNKNYLQALATFLSETYGRGDHLYAGLQTAIASRPAYTKIQRVSAVDLAEVRRFLVLGWTSEIQLLLPALMGNSAMIGFANAWAPVHAYYAAFGGLQAWFAANGMGGTANDHTAALKTVSAMIRDRDLFPHPWALLAIGCPMRKEREHLNVPAGADCVGQVEVLSNPAPFGADPKFWQRYGTWLRSTREARLLQREKQWKQTKKRTRISPGERTKIAARLPATSLFDCLWRLRIRSNYGTVDSYLVADISQGAHQTFNRSLATVVAATACLLEVYVARRIGKEQFGRMAREFVRQDQSGLTGRTLQARLAVYGIDTDG